MFTKKPLGGTSCASCAKDIIDMYGKKVDSKKCQAKFNKLTKAEIEKLFEALPRYIQSTPDKQYRKNPLTWLNGKCWNDEIQVNSVPGRNVNQFSGNYTKPEMRKRQFNRIKAGSKGGKPGQWSARKAQMLAKAYKDAGGGYT